MSKRRLVLTTTAIIFLLALVLGVYTVFTVNSVSVYYDVVSENGLKYSKEIQDKLEDKWLGKNILLIKEENVLSVFDEYPYVEEISARKVYPNKIVVYARENTERFAVESADKSYFIMFDSKGDKLGTNSVNKNAADSFRNILLSGFGYDGVSFANEEYFKCVLNMCDIADEVLGGVRTNFERVTLVRPTSLQSEDYIEIGTTEGVVIKIVNPLSGGEEKIRECLKSYLSLKSDERLYGVITAIEKVNGEGVSVTYTSRYGED